MSKYSTKFKLAHLVADKYQVRENETKEVCLNPILLKEEKGIMDRQDFRIPNDEGMYQNIKGVIYKGKKGEIYWMNKQDFKENGSKESLELTIDTIRDIDDLYMGTEILKRANIIQK